MSEEAVLNSHHLNDLPLTDLAQNVVLKAGSLSKAWVQILDPTFSESLNLQLQFSPPQTRGIPNLVGILRDSGRLALSNTASFRELSLH